MPTSAFFPGDDGRWDHDLLAHDPEASILQSAGQARLQAAEGWRPDRVRLRSGAMALVLVGGAPFARHAFVPFGPVPSDPGTVRELALWALDRGLVRLRVEPALGVDALPSLLAAGFRAGPSVTPGLGRAHARYLYPEHTQVVPLGDPDRMLADCRPKHRYNIRLALRWDVEVAIEDDRRELHRQQAATARRQGITTPDAGVYERRLRELDWCHIYVARVEGVPVGAIMVARFGARAYYLFGGTDGTHHERMPAYALQWRAMTDAAAAGCRHYDLFGLPPTGDPAHPWHGLWRFKTGFGGHLVTTPGALDLALRPIRARALALADRLRG